MSRSKPSDLQFSVSRQLLDYVALKKIHLEQMMKKLIEDERLDLEAELESLSWPSANAEEEKKCDYDKEGLIKFPFAKKFQNYWVHLQARGQIAMVFGRTNAESEQSIVQGCTDLQEQRCAVEKN